ncbi:MAG: hypothetical protein HYY76_08635 [Acidobacteria bacterium]|nr:hypothetical protein [Acidobacteriota bacterium]
MLVSDEAQHLDPAVFEQLRLLLNLETNEAKLLQIVLVGQTALNEVLERPETWPLNQRVARRCVLEPLTPAEVKRYIRHRVATAQRLVLAADLEALESGEAAAEAVPCHVSFTPAALRVVTQLSHGVPRIINLVCDRALEIGYERCMHTICARTVRRAAARAGGRRAARPPARSVGRRAGAALAAAAMAAFAIGAAGTSAWQAREGARRPPLPGAPPVFASAAARLAAPLDVTPMEVFDRLEIWNGPVTADPAAAGPIEVRLLRMVLLRRAAGVSLALELTAEPRKAALHTVSDRVLDLEVGPVAGPIRTEQFAPSSEASLISRVSIREYRALPGDGCVRVRVMLREPGRGDVRVAGRVVYVDVRPSGSLVRITDPD